MHFNRKLICFLVGVMSLQILTNPMTSLAAETENETGSWETPSGVTAEEFEKVCDENFQSHVGKDIAGAAITVVSNGKIVFEKGYGYQDIKNQIPYDPKETVVEIGSVSKLFTWTSAMQLAEEGKLNLTEDVNNYLPADFHMVNDMHEPVTMLDLMNHRGGFDDYLIHIFARKDNMVSLKEAVEEQKVRQVQKPGSVSSYSNYGAGLAGYVSENILNMPLYEHVENAICNPLGMDDTLMNPNLDVRPDLESRKAKAYAIEHGKLVEKNWSYVSMYPAGSIQSTMEDLSKFAIAYLHKSPVIYKQEQTFDEMLSKSSNDPEGVEGIAHGFIEYDGEYPTYWHNGGTEFFSTFFAIVPEADFAIMANTNSEGGIAVIQDFCFQMLQKKQVEMQIPQQNLPRVETVVGAYRDYRECHEGLLHFLSLFRGSRVVKKVAENEISIDGEQYGQIRPYVFQSKETGRLCSFQVENGKVIKFTEMLDYLPVSTWKTVSNICIITTFVVFMIFFIIMLIKTVIRVCRKNTKKGNIVNCLVIMEWILFGCATGLLVTKILQWNSMKEMMWIVLINRTIAIGIVVASLVGFTRLLKEKDKVSKAFYVCSIGVVCLLIQIGMLSSF